MRGQAGRWTMAAALILLAAAHPALAFLPAASCGHAVSFSSPLQQQQRATTVAQPQPSPLRRCRFTLGAASDSHTDVGGAAGAAASGADDEEEEEEELIPGKMKVGEIKAELDLRGVSYAGVFERNELEALLLDARSKGKARPEILDQFNEAQQTATDGNRQPDIDWESAKSGDGSLPGGVDAEALRKLTSNQEMMELMANDKLQEFMKAVMEQDMAAMQRMAADQEVLRMMQRFQELAMEAGLDPTQFSQGGGGI